MSLFSSPGTNWPKMAQIWPTGQKMAQGFFSLISVYNLLLFRHFKVKKVSLGPDIAPDHKSAYMHKNEKRKVLKNRAKIGPLAQIWPTLKSC